MEAKGPRHRIAAVIPTYNEMRSVASIVTECLASVDQVVVVDGGSEDGTCDEAARRGALVIQLDRRGLGRAKIHAIDTQDADILVFLDADGSHCPAEIPRLIEPICRGDADLVIGCRITGGSDELGIGLDHALRKLGMDIIQWVVNHSLSVQLTDAQNGFRAIRSSVARQLHLHEKGFCIDQQMTITCIRRGFRVVNVPSHEYRRRYGNSRWQLWKQWPAFLWNLAESLWMPLRNPVAPGGHLDGASPRNLS